MSWPAVSLTAPVQVNDLLSLKQQQASVVQAWESVNQAEEAVRQGRSIMIFTLITIVFVSVSEAHSRL